MHANFLLHKYADQRYWLQLPRSTIEIASKALGKYAVFSKVSIEDISAKYACFGVEPQLHAQLLVAHETIKGLLTPFFLHDLLSSVWLPRENLDRLLVLIGEEHNHWLGSAEWQKTIMRRGLGFVESSNSGEFIPQMLNLDCLDGISFTKGCYTGQEIIARMKYRGTVKRRCWFFSVDLTAFKIDQPVRTESIAQLASCAAAGAELRDAAGRVSGQILNSVVNSLGSTCGLAVIKTAQAEAGTPLYLHWAGAEGQNFSIPVTLAPPPYAIPNN